MAVCNNIFALAAFRYGFSALYILTATTLLSSFLIKKPDGLHRTLNTSAICGWAHFSMP